MEKNKINRLCINLACFSLTISLTSFATTLFTLSETNYDYEEVSIVFEPIENNNYNNSEKEDLIILRTHDIEESDNLNNYSGMNLSNEYEDYIRNLCDKYALEYDLDQDELFKNVLVIGDQESNGTWNTNGIVSETNDYGQFQINVANHEMIEDKLGITVDELLNDPKKNAEAAIFIIANIMISDYCMTDEDIYGMYNGWINWEEKEDSIKYVDGCLARYNMYFADDDLLVRK